MENTNYNLRLWIVMLTVVCLAHTAALATSIVWTNTASGSFGTAANWSPNAVPGSGDVAVITNSGTYTVTLDATRNVGGFQVGANSGGTQTFSMNGHLLTLSGDVTVNTNGAFIVSANLTAYQRILTNNGTVTWTGGTVLEGNPGAIYNNGLWDAQGDNTLSGDGNTGTFFYNAGTFRKSAGTATTTFTSFIFNNTGTLDVQTGTVNLAGGSGNNTSPGVFNTTNGATLSFGSYTFNTGSQFTGNGTNLLASGTFTMNGNITFTKLIQTGGVLAGNHVLNGLFVFKGGNWFSTGGTTIATNSTLNIANQLNLSQRILTNNGTVTWTGGTVLEGNPGAIYNNGLWDAQGDNTLSGDGNTGTFFYNAGTFRKSAGTATTTFTSFIFNNTGTLDVQTGTVNLAGGSGNNTSPGVFNTTNGATLSFGSYTFNTGSQFTGNGTNLLASGTFTMNGNITFTKLIQTGGVLAGNHVLNGLFVFKGGNWFSTGGTTIATNSTLNIANQLNLSQRILTNNGTVTWTGGTVLEGNPGAIYNNGLWDAQGDNTLSGDGNTGTFFYNAGTFRKSAGTATTTFTSFIFNNTGTLDVQTGTVNLSSAHTLTGGTINIGISSLSSFGKVSLSGAAGLAGTFTANLNGGYVPVRSNVFTAITYGSLSGNFTNYSLPAVVPWVTNSGGTTFTLTVGNSAPVAQNLTMGVMRGGSGSVQVIGGKYAPTDANGDTLTVASLSGAVNGSASTDGTRVTFTSTNGASSGSFSYTVSDGFGGTDTKTVSVVISDAQGFNQLSSVNLGNGDLKLTYLGIPGTNYALDRTFNLTPPVTWTAQITNPAAFNGYLIFTNTPQANTNNFFRTRYVP